MNEKRINRIFEAYWISPAGLINGVNITHIQDIINNPEYFSLTREGIEKTFNKYNEKLGFEGKARKEIMTKLLLNRWIRIRRKKDNYIMETDEYDDDARKCLKEFCSGMIDAGVHKNTDMNIATTAENSFRSFDEIQNDDIQCDEEVLRYVER